MCHLLRQSVASSALEGRGNLPLRFFDIHSFSYREDKSMTAREHMQKLYVISLVLLVALLSGTVFAVEKKKTQQTQFPASILAASLLLAISQMRMVLS